MFKLYLIKVLFNIGVFILDPHVIKYKSHKNQIYKFIKISFHVAKLKIYVNFKATVRNAPPSLLYNTMN